MSTDRFYHGKPCRKCGLTDRYRASRACVHCKRKAGRAWSKKRAWQEVNLRRRFGLTLLEYRAMLERQGGVCAICETDACATGRRFAVDHCHKTQRNRGILCKSCNVALGELKDDPSLLRRAAVYLEESRNV